jgi:hypothetical protein
MLDNNTIDKVRVVQVQPDNMGSIRRKSRNTALEELLKVVFVGKIMVVSLIVTKGRWFRIGLFGNSERNQTS